MKPTDATAARLLTALRFRSKEFCVCTLAAVCRNKNYGDLVMPILTATELGHSFGADDLFEDINLKLEDRDRVGLVGPNGVGKTTLLLLLAGQLAPTAGRVDRAREVTTGTLRQEAVLAFAGQDNSVYEEMRTVFSSLREREIELREMEAAMSSGESSAQLLDDLRPFAGTI